METESTYCDSCGDAINLHHNFCQNCGREIISYIEDAMEAREIRFKYLMENETRNEVIG